MTLGKYEVLNEIGKGGFGAVYRARDTVHGREVALKVLKPAWIDDARAVEIFHLDGVLAGTRWSEAREDALCCSPPMTVQLPSMRKPFRSESSPVSPLATPVEHCENTTR